MSTFALRLPASSCAHAKLLAEQDQASLNRFITVAVAEKVSAVQTAEFFAQR
jgi:predicted HicB family RNase H-like nuclease